MGQLDDHPRVRRYGTQLSASGERNFGRLKTISSDMDNNADMS